MAGRTTGRDGGRSNTRCGQWPTAPAEPKGWSPGSPAAGAVQVPGRGCRLRPSDPRLWRHPGLGGDVLASVQLASMQTGIGGDATAPRRSPGRGRRVAAVAAAVVLVAVGAGAGWPRSAPRGWRRRRRCGPCEGGPAAPSRSRRAFSAQRTSARVLRLPTAAGGCRARAVKRPPGVVVQCHAGHVSVDGKEVWSWIPCRRTVLV